MTLNTSYAANPVPQFETTRMKGTAGAGVASVLMDEATYLNPATIAYWNKGSVYYQKSGLDSTPTNKTDPTTQAFSSQSIIVSDAKGSSGGSLSYNTIDYQGQTVKRFAAAFAHPIGKKSSLGVTGVYTKESLYDENDNLVSADYKQTTIGVAMLLMNPLVLVLSCMTPFKRKMVTQEQLLVFSIFFQTFLLSCLMLVLIITVTSLRLRHGKQELRLSSLATSMLALVPLMIKD